jgi:hypothetical protein
LNEGDDTEIETTPPTIPGDTTDTEDVSTKINYSNIFSTIMSELLDIYGPSSRGVFGPQFNIPGARSLWERTWWPGGGSVKGGGGPGIWTESYPGDYGIGSSNVWDWGQDEDVVLDPNNRNFGVNVSDLQYSQPTYENFMRMINQGFTINQAREKFGLSPVEGMY